VSVLERELLLKNRITNLDKHTKSSYEISSKSFFSSPLCSRADIDALHFYSRDNRFESRLDFRLSWWDKEQQRKSERSWWHKDAIHFFLIKTSNKIIPLQICVTRVWTSTNQLHYLNGIVLRHDQVARGISFVQHPFHHQCLLLIGSSPIKYVPLNALFCIYLHGKLYSNSIETAWILWQFLVFQEDLIVHK
jgi:hypothetical protein